MNPADAVRELLEENDELARERFRLEGEVQRLGKLNRENGEYYDKAKAEWEEHRQRIIETANRYLIRAREAEVKLKSKFIEVFDTNSLLVNGESVAEIIEERDRLAVTSRRLRMERDYLRVRSRNLSSARSELAALRESYEEVEERFRKANRRLSDNNLEPISTGKTVRLCVDGRAPCDIHPGDSIEFVVSGETYTALHSFVRGFRLRSPWGTDVKRYSLDEIVEGIKKGLDNE